MTSTRNSSARVALVTGGSRGLGAALVRALVERDWRVVLDGRDPVRLAEFVDALPSPRFVTAVPGDVADPAHRHRLLEAVDSAGGLDLLVNNASTLGQVPLPPLAEYRLDELQTVLAVNTIAPLALAQGVTFEAASDVAPSSIQSFNVWICSAVSRGPLAGMILLRFAPDTS